MVARQVPRRDWSLDRSMHPFVSAERRNCRRLLLEARTTGASRTKAYWTKVAGRGETQLVEPDRAFSRVKRSTMSGTSRRGTHASPASTTWTALARNVGTSRRSR